MTWLTPSEGTEHATLTGVPCLLSYIGGNPIDEGTAFKVWGGGLMFECNGRYVTNDVTAWRPKEPNGTAKIEAPLAVPVKLKRLPHGEGLALPSKAHPTDAGIDLPCSENFMLEPAQSKLIGTGFAIEIPDGYEAQIRPRSGLALKRQITVLNAPGTIDASYRGELKVILINHGLDLQHFARGDRIAQMVIQPVVPSEVQEVVEVSETDRNANGFGSTGQ